MPLLDITELQRRRTSWPLLALGFRPFFLLAGLFSIATVPVWLLIYQGYLEPSSHLPPTIWHGHELVFGVVAAVIAGFLLTAVSNWTGRRTATGAALGALAALWIAGRVALLAGTWLPAAIGIAIDLAFLPALAIVLAIPLIATGNRRNIGFPALLLVLTAVNASIHLGGIGVIDWDPSRGLRVAIDIILLMIGLLGGRVIPMFTRNALPEARVNPCAKASLLALLSLAALAVADLISGAPAITGPVALAAGIVNLLRMRGWGGLATLRTPILWILHAGYLWLALGLMLRGIAELTDLVPLDAALHALTLGAIGSMILGMMSRVALGHTGRDIAAAPLTIAAYGLVNAAALLRVITALTTGEVIRPASLIGSGVLWSLAFLCFTVVYLPILMRHRIDGRPG